MLYPKNNRFISGLFHRYVGYIINRNFQAINYNAVAVDAGKSVLLLANHFSWWDGFLMYWLNHLVIKKKFHVMVVEDTLHKTPLLRYLGAFSVLKNSRSMLQSLNYAAELLADPQNLVLIFPQARLYSNLVDTLHFEKGLSKIIKQAAGKFQYVFSASFIENFQYKKPLVNVYVNVMPGAAYHIDELTTLFNAHYQQAKQQQTQIVV